MQKILLPLVGLVAAFVAAQPASAAPSASEEASARQISISTRNAALPVHQRVTLGLGKAAVVEIDTDARDVLVSNPDIVDAVVRTPRRIFLMGQKGGQTNAFFFDANGKQIASIDVRVEKDTTDLAKLIKLSFPDTDVKAQAINDTVVLTGHVASAQESQRAVDIAASFTGDPKKVVNVLAIRSSDQVMLKVRIAEMQRTVAKQFGIDMTSAMTVAGVPMTFGTANQFGLVGHALNDLSGGQIGSVCPDHFFPTTTSTIVSAAANAISSVAGATGGTVTSTSTYDPVTQTWSTPTITRSGSSTNSSSGTNSSGSSSQSTTTTPCSSPNNLQGAVKALEQVGLVHILAEPNLTAVSGETAKFLAGGEFPVPVARDRDGNITVDYKQFGVGLSFTPVVLGPGRISLQLSTEVSELSSLGAYSIAGSTPSSGLTLPALAVRRAQTTVEVPSGGSFSIAGLMQHSTKQVIDAFPGAKDLPILGALFRSRDFSNEESELVVLVTAYLVKPTVETKLAAPTDGFVVPTDLETILLGRLNAVYGGADKTKTAQAPGGYIVE
jgi:pilus assembly protein CpaC